MSQFSDDLSLFFEYLSRTVPTITGPGEAGAKPLEAVVQIGAHREERV